MEATTPPQKKVKLGHGSPSEPDAARIRMQRSAFLASLSRPVSPPVQTICEVKNGVEQNIAQSTATPRTEFSFPSTLSWGGSDDLSGPNVALPKAAKAPKMIASPFRLTRIHGLPEEANIGTVTIQELLGSPLLKEAWIFNYCHDVDWTMQQFDPDIRDLVSVKIVHGFWKQESRSKIAIDDACRRYVNVKAIQAYLPDPFGTHHSKMLVLLRHDDLAQVVIHTANMLPSDWENTTQAAWCSPLLPLQSVHLRTPSSPGRLGSGARFKHDLLSYLQGYRNRVSPLVNTLQKHDFTAVHSVLIGSIPSKTTAVASTQWGYVALRNALKNIPTKPLTTSKSSSTTLSKPIVVCQISSIATFTKSWLEDTLFKALAPTTDARFSIVFPTPAEVRDSLDGYCCGGSIHCKNQTAAHKTQVDFLHSRLCHWTTPNPTETTMNAMRGSAAPHIKTYLRLCASEGEKVPEIEWALLTSANLSVQAWGTALKQPSKKERDEERLDQAFVHIQSYELGVLVWPGLFADEGECLRMVPVFGRDVPSTAKDESDDKDGRRLGSLDEREKWKRSDGVVGLRMPYDLPLTPYKVGEQPWSPQEGYQERDAYGNSWPIRFGG